jgi:hypothetical protein
MEPLGIQLDHLVRHTSSHFPYTWADGLISKDGRPMYQTEDIHNKKIKTVANKLIGSVIAI